MVLVPVSSVLRTNLVVNPKPPEQPGKSLPAKVLFEQDRQEKIPPRSGHRLSRAAENPVSLGARLNRAAKNPVLLKGTASAVPQVSRLYGALAPEVRFSLRKAHFRSL
jgi:hypothetical protein